MRGRGSSIRASRRDSPDPGRNHRLPRRVLLQDAVQFSTSASITREAEASAHLWNGRAYPVLVALEQRVTIRAARLASTSNAPEFVVSSDLSGSRSVLSPHRPQAKMRWLGQDTIHIFL